MEKNDKYAAVESDYSSCNEEELRIVLANAEFGNQQLLKHLDKTTAELLDIKESLSKNQEMLESARHELFLVKDLFKAVIGIPVEEYVEKHTQDDKKKEGLNE